MSERGWLVALQRGFTIPKADETGQSSSGRLTRFGFSALGSLELQDEGQWVPYAEAQEVVNELTRLAQLVEAIQQGVAPIDIPDLKRRRGLEWNNGGA